MLGFSPLQISWTRHSRPSTVYHFGWLVVGVGAPFALLLLHTPAWPAYESKEAACSTHTVIHTHKAHPGSSLDVALSRTGGADESRVQQRPRQYRSSLDSTAAPPPHVVMRGQQLVVKMHPEENAHKLSQGRKKDKAKHPAHSNHSVCRRAVVQAQPPVQLDAHHALVAPVLGRGREANRRPVPLCEGRRPAFGGEGRQGDALCNVFGRRE